MGMQMNNNNYYQWRAKDELIFGGAKKKLKNKINLIMAINDGNIAYYYFTTEKINSQIMQKFFEDLLKKIEDDINKYVIILDNASYHVSDDIQNYLYNKKIKKITYCPYFSPFNPIEYEFLIKKRNKVFSLIISI